MSIGTLQRRSTRPPQRFGPLSRDRIQQPGDQRSGVHLGHRYRKDLLAKVVGYDRTEDVTVLQLKETSGLKNVSMGDSSTVRAVAPL